MKEYFDRVTENFETLIINRGKNSGVVVISLDEYNALVTTPHEMSPEKIPTTKNISGLEPFQIIHINQPAEINQHVLRLCLHR
jgi:hypothetical protein